MDLRIANVYSAYGAYNAKNTSGVKKADQTGRTGDHKDSFSLSMKAEDYQTVRKALADVPDIRGDKVDQIKARIEANAYHVNASDIAAKLLKKSDE